MQNVKMYQLSEVIEFLESQPQADEIKIASRILKAVNCIGESDILFSKILQFEDLLIVKNPDDNEEYLRRPSRMKSNELKIIS